MSSLLVFPGQGAQQPGMLQRLPPNPLVQACLQEAAQVLGEDPLTLDSPPPWPIPGPCNCVC